MRGGRGRGKEGGGVDREKGEGVEVGRKGEEEGEEVGRRERGRR